MADGSRKRAPRKAPRDEGAAAPPPAGPDDCPVAFCPVSMLLTATGSVRPDVVEHLLAAGRELLLAMQVVVNARAEGTGRRSSLEKIDIG